MLQVFYYFYTYEACEVQEEKHFVLMGKQIFEEKRFFGYRLELMLWNWK